MIDLKMVEKLLATLAGTDVDEEMKTSLADLLDSEEVIFKRESRSKMATDEFFSRAYSL